SDFSVRVIGSDSESEETGTLDADEDRWLALEIDPNPAGNLAVRLHMTSSARCDLPCGKETRTVGLGVLGFYVCREDDLLARQRFVEAVQFRRLHRLVGRPPGREERSRLGEIGLSRDAAGG